MKKIYGIIYSVVFVLILTACSKEALVENKGAEPSPEEEVKYIDVTFGAEFPVPAELQDNAKTMLDSDLSVLWCKGDEIAVNTNGIVSGKTNLYLATFSSTVNPEDAHRATFSGTVNDNATSFIAVYPAANVKLGSTWNADITSDGTVYNVLPTEQTAIAESFTNGCAISYVIGSVSNGKLTENVEFNNLCSILTFTMPNYVEGAQSVKIQSNNNIAMSGGCVITRNLSILTNMFEYKGFAASNKKDETHNYVTVTAPNTASKFYAVIFPGNYASGFNITVTTADGQIYSRNVTKALNAQANHIYNLGTLGVVLDEGKVSPTVSIEQNLSTGSIATLNMTVSDVFKDMVTKWIVELCDKNGVVIRKSEITDGNLSNIVMDVTPGHTLIPAGDYTIKVSYNMPTGSTRKISKVYPASAPQFNVTVTDLEAESNLTYSGGVLTGTDIKVTSFTTDVLPEIAAKIQWVNFNLKDANGTLYRTSTKLNEVMTVQNSLPYIPNGTYKLTAGFLLTELGGTDIAETAPFDVTVSHTPTFGVSLTSAKTSYDYYKAGSVNTANGCSNMGIYELAAKVTGISDAVATQMAGKFTYEWFLDSNSIGKTENTNAAVSGVDKNTDNAVKVAFGNKKVSCKATFDGGSSDLSNKAVDITGLPYTVETTSGSITGWTCSGTKKPDGAEKLCFNAPNAGKVKGLTTWTYADNHSYAISPKFALPETTNISASIYCYAYGGSLYGRYAAYIYMANSSVDVYNNQVKYYSEGTNTVPSKASYNQVSCNNLSFNNSVAQLCIHVLGKRGPGTTSLNGVIGVCAEKITISYR